ncbi:hypothetical protein ACF0H5_024356 [Mactra antiquata]
MATEVVSDVDDDIVVVATIVESITLDLCSEEIVDSTCDVRLDDNKLGIEETLEVEISKLEVNFSTIDDEVVVKDTLEAGKLDDEDIPGVGVIELVIGDIIVELDETTLDACITDVGITDVLDEIGVDVDTRAGDDDSTVDVRLVID